MTDLLLRIRDGAWLDEQSYSPLAWAVPGIIPEGFGLFTGPPKAGKSWAALGVALAVASGGAAFGRIPVGPARPVLLLALEDGERRLQERSRHLLCGEPIPKGFQFVVTSTPAEVLELVTGWLAVVGHSRPLVVLDTLGRVLPAALPGEGAYQRDYRVGARLKGLVDEHPGACLLAVHHVRKASTIEGDWMDSTSGTNGLNGAADFTVNLARPRGETSGILRVTGRDVPDGEYAVTNVSGSWTLDGRSLDEAAKVAAQAKVTAGLGDRSAEILAFVARADEPVAAADVEAALNMSDARRYLARLVEAGRLHRAARGRYTLRTPFPSVPLSQTDTPETDPVNQDALERDNGTDGTPTPRDCHLLGGGAA